jgi:hypothetical protein
LNYWVRQAEEDPWNPLISTVPPYLLRVDSLGPQGFEINFRASQKEANSRKAHVLSLHLRLLHFGSLDWQ